MSILLEDISSEYYWTLFWFGPVCKMALISSEGNWGKKGN